MKLCVIILLSCSGIALLRGQQTVDFRSAYNITDISTIAFFYNKRRSKYCGACHASDMWSNICEASTYCLTCKCVMIQSHGYATPYPITQHPTPDTHYSVLYGNESNNDISCHCSLKLTITSTRVITHTHGRLPYSSV